MSEFAGAMKYINILEPIKNLWHLYNRGPPERLSQFKVHMIRMRSLAQNHMCV